MKFFITFLLHCNLVMTQIVYCQHAPINKIRFFEDENKLDVTIETNWSKLIKQKYLTGHVYAGRFKLQLADSTIVNEKVLLKVRGHFRREYCYFPPVKLIFDKESAPVTYPLKSIKLVSACRPGNSYEQYLLKEFIAYKIYNLITDKSFRVRLLQINYKDSNEKKKGFILPGFFLEDTKDIASRNSCVEWGGTKQNTEATNRSQMTLVAIFQYMIGNTDWSVKAMHNIKLIQSSSDLLSKPFAIPYDFDYAGLVNTEYAIPDPLLNTINVEKRVYRGFARTMEELTEALSVFIQQKAKIYSLIQNFKQLSPKSKKNMINYLDEFYKIIKNPKDVKSIFIDNARTENSI